MPVKHFEHGIVGQEHGQKGAVRALVYADVRRPRYRWLLLYVKWDTDALLRLKHVF